MKKLFLEVIKSKNLACHWNGPYLIEISISDTNYNYPLSLKGWVTQPNNDKLVHFDRLKLCHECLQMPTQDHLAVEETEQECGLSDGNDRSNELSNISRPIRRAKLWMPIQWRSQTHILLGGAS